VLRLVQSIDQPEGHLWSLMDEQQVEDAQRGRLHWLLLGPSRDVDRGRLWRRWLIGVAKSVLSRKDQRSTEKRMADPPSRRDGSEDTERRIVASRKGTTLRTAERANEEKMILEFFVDILERSLSVRGS
jgi:hypothetical protein